MKAHSDEELIEFILQGQATALDELYARYSRKLFVFCDHTLGIQNSQQAEDLVQEVFIRVIKAAQSFDPRKASFRTWLYRIARNRCIDAQRRKRHFIFRWSSLKMVTMSADQNLPLEEVLADPKADIESQMIETNLYQAIRDCIQSLQNQEEKQAILLYFLSGKVYREIAEILGKSLSTAKNRVHSAQEKVKACLADRGFP